MTDDERECPDCGAQIEDYDHGVGCTECTWYTKDDYLYDNAEEILESREWMRASEGIIEYR